MKEGKEGEGRPTMVMNSLQNSLLPTQQDQKAHAAQLQQEVTNMRQQVKLSAMSGGLKYKAAAEVNTPVGPTRRQVTITFGLS